MPRARTYHSKKQFAYETLRDDILHGVLQPGTRLIIDELASELGVSPIPVREALQRLQYDGLVTIEPYMGARVTEVHVGLIEEVFALLEATEVISGQMACQRMKDVDFQAMDDLLRRMDDEVGDLDRWTEDNVRLHELICERSGMSLVLSVMQQVLDHWDRLCRHFLAEVITGRMWIAQQQHWQLLAALRTRDVDHVAEVIRCHNRQALTSYLDHLAGNGQPEYGAPGYRAG